MTLFLVTITMSWDESKTFAEGKMKKKQFQTAIEYGMHNNFLNSHQNQIKNILHTTNTEINNQSNLYLIWFDLHILTASSTQVSINMANTHYLPHHHHHHHQSRTAASSTYGAEQSIGVDKTSCYSARVTCSCSLTSQTDSQPVSITETINNNILKVCLESRHLNWVELLYVLITQ